MRADGINPRVGMTVAFCSIFLIFGFMFAVSGMSGEALGPVPLIALGPAVFIPALVVIILATKTNGFHSWPWPWPRLQTCRGRCCCAQRKEKNRLGWGSPEDLEGLYSLEVHSELSSGGSEWSDKAHVGKLKDCCPSGGLKGALAGFSSLQQECVRITPPYTLVVAHTAGGVPFRDDVMVVSGVRSGLHCYYPNVRWGDETIV